MFASLNGSALQIPPENVARSTWFGHHNMMLLDTRHPHKVSVVIGIPDSWYRIATTMNCFPDDSPYRMY